MSRDEALAIVLFVGFLAIALGLLVALAGMADNAKPLDHRKRTDK